MHLVIHDASLRKVAFVDNTKQNTLKYIKYEWYRSLETAGSTFTVTIQKKAIQSDNRYDVAYNHLNERSFITFKAKKKTHLFSVMVVTENEETITCTCESSNLELINEYANPYKATKAMTFVEHCNAMDLLSFTYLTIGLNEVSDKSLTLEWEGQDTKLARLLSLAKKFDAEIEFDTRLNADSSIKQFILNVYHKNDDTHQGVGRIREDVRLVYEKNVKSITRTIDKTNVVNAIRPTGVNDGNTVVISGLGAWEEKNEDGVVEFYQKGEMLYAPISMQLYPSTFTHSTINDQWTRKDITVDSDNPTVIRAEGIKALKRLAYPSITYEVDGFFDGEIGDTVKVIDNGFVPKLILKARVIEQYIYDDETKNKTVLGNFTALENRISDDMQARLNELVEQAKIDVGGVNLALGTDDIRHVKADGTINYLWRMANSLSDYGIKEGNKMTISAELSPVSTKVQKLKLWAEEYLSFFDYNMNTNGKMSVNELGLVGGAFIQDDAKWSYIPPNTSSSEAQTLVIRGLLRNYIVSGNKDFLETAEFLTDGLLNYYYPTPQIPTEPDPKWIPHWMVNVNGPFRSREWRIDGVANFVDGRATFESPEVMRVWSVRANDATLQYDWSPDAPVIGTEYKIKSTNVLWGQSKVEIELETLYTGQALVVYTAETGPIIDVGEKCEAYPVWRPLGRGEIACAVDVLPWVIDVFNLWFEITGDERWKMAIASTKSAIVEASAVTNIEYYLKAGKDSESVLINGVTSFSDRTPVETYTNDNGRIKIEYQASDGEATIGTWVGDKLEFSNNKWVSVKIGSNKQVKATIVIDEEASYDPNKRWYHDFTISGSGMEVFDLYPKDFYRSDRVVWGSGYGKSTEGAAVNSGQSSVVKQIVNDANKEVTKLTLTKGDEGGWLGWAQYMLSIWGYSLPFDFKYKTDSDVNFVINAGGIAHTLLLPKTNGEYSTITITGDSFDTPFTGSSYDSFVIEAVSQVSTIYIDYIGFLDKFDKEYLTNVAFRYSGQDATTIYLEYIKPEPTRTPLKYSPYLMPFDFHLINYQFTTLRGAIYSGYQAPWIYQESIFPDVAEAVSENLLFLKDAQDAYLELQGHNGFFAPIYWWNYRDDYGENEPDTFGIEGNWGHVWGGFQYRTISDVARVFLKEPNNSMAHTIFMRFLRGIDQYWVDVYNGFPTAFNPGGPPHKDQTDPQMVSNFTRALIYGWESSLLTSEDKLLIKKLAYQAFDWLEHYRLPVGLFDSSVEGTWSPDAGNETWYGYWGGELLDLMALAQTSTLFFDEDTEAVFEETGVQFYLNPPGTVLFDEQALVGEGKFSKTFRVSAAAAALIMDEQRLGISLLNNSQSLIAIKKLKIEIGNKPTGYSKANEETVLYSQFSKIEKTIKGFKQTVQNTKADKTTVTQLADLWETTAVQLTEVQQIIANLQAQIEDLTQQLDEATKPEETIEGE